MTEQQSITIKEYIQLQIANLEREINRLNADHVGKARYDQLQLQVASLSEAVQELEQRLEILETHDRIGRWAFGIVTSVATALLIGWLSGLIG